jgi:tryptophanyl-tRNA synthetase
VEKLAPIAGEMRRLLADPGHIDQVLREGAERAAAIAEPVLAEAYELVGFLRP